MDKFWQIFRLVKAYKRGLYANLFFNLLNAVLSLFTFAAIVPFLRILFGVYDHQPTMPAPTEGMSGRYYYELLTYKLDFFIQTNGAIEALAWMCVFIVLLALVKNLMLYFSLYSIATIRTGVARDLRNQLYDHAIALDLSYYSNERKGDIISRMTNDLMEIEFSVIGTLEIIFKSPILILIYLGSLFAMSWQLTLFALIFLPVSGFLISRIAKTLKNAAGRGKHKLGELIGTIDETLTGLRIIKAFDAEDRFKQRFRQHNEGYFRLMLKLYRREYLSSPMSEFISIAVIAILLFAGGQVILGGSSWMSGEVFILYLIVFSQIIPPARAFSDAVFKIKKGSASLERINEILHAPIRVNEAPDSVDIPSFEREIEFRNVSFAYDDKEVLSDVSFTIRKGETVALVGHSGGGKSTLANLLARFYDPTGGSVNIDGHDIRSLKVSSLRRLLGVVTQDSILFNDTVANNIALGSPTHSEESIQNASEVANAREFIDTLPGGYAFEVGDGGGKLSGGQKQRLSIARAIHKNPPILILDEATSALDTRSEVLVQEAINRLMKHRTSLVIAHRLSTIRQANRILVIQNGRIAEQGTHDELMALGGVYKSLVDMQRFD
jgi:ATP-binding cassette, subfamily B, bacterial MsbA